mmetsp:Transcript_81140/g.160836  ORF Transcript_81140/g.160836 Transcript_81140/m.160836 type:complete len:282 (-) Transcript_81140:853-1698(-)
MAPDTACSTAGAATRRVGTITTHHGGAHGHWKPSHAHHGWHHWWPHHAHAHAKRLHAHLHPNLHAHAQDTLGVRALFGSMIPTTSGTDPTASSVVSSFAASSLALTIIRAPGFPPVISRTTPPLPLLFFTWLWQVLRRRRFENSVFTSSPANLSKHQLQCLLLLFLCAEYFDASFGLARCHVIALLYLYVCACLVHDVPDCFASTANHSASIAIPHPKPEGRQFNCFRVPRLLPGILEDGAILRLCIRHFLQDEFGRTLLPFDLAKDFQTAGRFLNLNFRV